MQPAQNPCHWCDDFPCAQACPSGALLPTAAPPSPLARVSLDLDFCLTREGTLCSDCAYACPPGVGAITLSGGRTPELNSERCVGCGLCIDFCEARPSPFRLHTPERRSPNG